MTCVQPFIALYHTIAAALLHPATHLELWVVRVHVEQVLQHDVPLRLQGTIHRVDPDFGST